MLIQENNLPFQPMLGDENIVARKLHGHNFQHAGIPHRHRFFMVMWATGGEGRHFIDFKEYSLTPGTLFAMQIGQVHQVRSYPEEGWVVLFTEDILWRFLAEHPGEEQRGIFDIYHAPSINMDTKILEETFTPICEQLSLPLHPDMKYHYLALLLLTINGQGIGDATVNIPDQNLEVFRKLKLLVGSTFKFHYGNEYYAKTLGLSLRKLNNIAKQLCGLSLSEMISERLLNEGKAMLGATNRPVKEIAYELGFTDQHYFGKFFKKHTACAPSDFRTRLTLKDQ